jgi:hypothetical protein
LENQEFIREVRVPARSAPAAIPVCPKPDIEPRIARIDTDYEEVLEMISKPV